MIKSTVVASTLLVAVLAAPSEANVLINPGFEAGSLLPWYQAADYSGLYEPWNVTIAEAHSGSYSATAVGNKRIQQDFAPIPVANILEVSFWQRQPEPLAALAIYFAYQDGTNEQIVRSGTTDWGFLDFTSELDSGKRLVGVGVWGYLNNVPPDDRTYVDDLVLRDTGAAVCCVIAYIYPDMRACPAAESSFRSTMSAASSRVAQGSLNLGYPLFGTIRR